MRRPGWRELSRVVPRTAVFASKAGRASANRPVPGLRRSPWTLTQVLVDDLVVTVMQLRGRDAAPDFERHREEQQRAVDVLRGAGAFDDASVLFPTPPAVSQTRLTRRRRYGSRFEHVSFESMWSPPAGLPRAEQWAAEAGNFTSHAYLLRHDGRPRPWVVAIHGYGAGEPYDLWWMGSLAVHRQLHVNVMNVVLPRHGPRGRVASDDRFPGLDALVNLYGFVQAIWDIRRGVSWARAQGATAIGVHGISLGAYTAALLAGVEPEIDCVVAGTPVVDFAQLIARHAARYAEDPAIVELIRDGAAAELNHLVSPLTYAPLLPRERRFVYAGVGDRMATPEQAVALWRHWEEPKTQWIQGSHIGAALSRRARQFVYDAFRACGVSGVTASTP